jgi:hypothetical protein
MAQTAPNKDTAEVTTATIIRFDPSFMFAPGVDGEQFQNLP